jgi:MoaA/NifB/PqqE/SkfB family radical SAM enzyme
MPALLYVRALKLLQERQYNVSVSMCVHRDNRDSLRESVKLMASLGVKRIKCGSMMADAFMYTPGEDQWQIYNVRRISLHL